MPRPHANGARRTRGSWTPRIIGIGAVVLVAIFGAIAYLVASPAIASRHPEHLSTRVLSVQTVGIVGQVPAGASGNSLRLLTITDGGIQFGPMPPAELEQGNPQWTADTMVGGTYIFIYAPSGKCLASTGQRQPVLTLKRCDLGPQQRWQRAKHTTQSAAHEYGQYRNLGSGRCLSTGAALDDQADDSAALASCGSPAPARQLASFWWAA
jgi:hypothetical protein